MLLILSQGEGVLTSYSRRGRDRRMDALLTGNRIPLNQDEDEDESKANINAQYVHSSSLLLYVQ